MKYRPRNSLAHYNAAPHVHQHDFSALPVSVIASASKTYKTQGTKSSPMDDAVSFYTLNHCASIVRKRFTENEPLPEWAQEIMQSYTDVCLTHGERMLHYILLVTTREMRHLSGKGKPTLAFWTAVQTQFGSDAQVVLEQIAAHHGEDGAMAQYLNFSSSATKLTVGAYVKTLSYGFHKAEGWSGPSNSHGGPLWGNVVDAAVAMLHGKMSLEQLVDTGFTLAHNGGPIFNKGHLYLTQDAAKLLTILDVQRSGQLPDLMLDVPSQSMHVKKTPDAVHAVELIQTHYPQDAKGIPTLKGYVDWALVEALRPAADKTDNYGKYALVISQQKHQPLKKKAGKKVAIATPVVPEPEPSTVEEVSTEVMTTLLGTKIKVVGEWAVYPHQKVKIVEREKE